MLMQNDLVHGWGLDFALRKCVDVSGNTFYFLQLIDIEVNNFLFQV